MEARYRIRIKTAGELALPIEWAAAEGWNPGLHDAPCFHAADPRRSGSKIESARA